MRERDAPSECEPPSAPEGVAAAYHESSPAITSQAIAPLLAAARVGSGMRVLDVACGAGDAANAAVELGASAVGVDLSAAQVALAARTYPATAFLTADAGALPFGDGAFDAVVSNFGMPHFRDPERFLREAQRVLRPGGRIAFTSWIDPDPQLGRPLPDSAAREAEPFDPAVPGPGFFRFGDADHCRRALEAAGFRTADVEVARVSWRVAAPDSFLDVVMEGVGRAAGLLEAETPEALAAIREALREQFDEISGSSGLKVAMPAVLAWAEKAVAD